MTLAADSTTFARRFSSADTHPYDEVEWEQRDARLSNFQTGAVSFEQHGVEFPRSWSLNGSNIVSQKYFRGTIGTSEREWSLRQVIDRVADTITRWGQTDGYFVDDDEAAVFADELKWLLLHQRAAFNSPVWFNIGVPNVPQQASACFILSVDDQMDSILNWYAEEGRIFKGGSGAGANLSRIRSSKELLRGGGEASGPVSFMRGADASAGTIKSGGKTRRAAKMVLLDADHPDVEEFIWCKAIEERKARVLRDAGFDMDLDGSDSFSVQYQNANNSVRLTDDFMRAVEADGTWDLMARTSDDVIETVSARTLFRHIAEAAWECADPGVQFSTTINSWHTAPNTGPINASNPCSEYVHLDNSACNLASMNLLTFLGEDGVFDVDGFRHGCSIIFTAQDILVGNADYPTEKIGETSHRFRQLGLGFTNLGASLMALGMPYNSAEGRSWTGAISALMTGSAYATSTRLAERLGPFAGYEENRLPMQDVLRRHRAALAHIEPGAPEDMLAAAREDWDAAVSGCEAHGVRNSQATVIAPTGTISFMMDCDTTGIEPDLGLVKFKKLVGGGNLSIVNQTIGRALSQLGYSDGQVAEIETYILDNATIMGAPHLGADHLPVFACSMGDNVIHHDGHVKMMAAVQPFVSGAISKTINLPEDATVAEVEDLHMLSWKLGLKAVAIYRDNCKVGQPLSTGKGEASDEAPTTNAALDETAIAEAVNEAIAEMQRIPVREKLPRTRSSRTFSFRVADCHGYMTVGEYGDGRPGEIFLTVAKQGSTLAGIMDAFAISVSHGLQYGVPLRAYVEAFTNVRFEPAGITDDPELRIASSLVDYIVRRMALQYLPYEERIELGVLATQERMDPPLPGFEAVAVESSNGTDLIPVPAEPTTAPTPRAQPVASLADAPMCYSCGVNMVRAGACHSCPSCGNTSGCG
ncbi:MAG: ribonucleoside-diphosphate reductase alpha chain [Candidatus Poriferisodalaceae bacterium]|jgi:ribonucleoside-diphosphate reductase alpha chain